MLMFQRDKCKFEVVPLPPDKHTMDLYGKTIGPVQKGLLVVLFMKSGTSNRRQRSPSRDSREFSSQDHR